ncbi:hypothetical protein K469DRAFT_689282 [Zopfia rhizophila CBS 207.26]|uniref:Fungal N-terminal domain-containing protein n=1 Tax=Zopfia rhizophila CBS 207.26 TaxID=1314779 RepID=A0A6A6ETZ1_9PEZI|nr:hypothetical protein K469DRAFT_689282 [Zopfia rhizophila CBS 207.26]
MRYLMRQYREVEQHSVDSLITITHFQVPCHGPLSFTASLITVVAAAGSVAKHLELLRNGLGNAPDMLGSLIDEVSDLRIVLEACNSAVTELYSNVDSPNPPIPLADASQALDRTKCHLDHLYDLVSSCFDSDLDVSKTRPVVMFRWMKIRSKTEVIQQLLQDSKQGLLMLMESQSVSTMSGMQLTVQNITVGVEEDYSTLDEKLDEILFKVV